MTKTRLTAVAAAGATALMMITACAAHGARNQARVGAVTFSHLAHDVKVTEDQVYAAGIPQYDQAAHRKVQQGIRKLLVAADAYDKAVRDWTDGATAPQAVLESQKALTGAVDELSQAFPKVSAVSGPMNRAINALRAALATQSSAEMPGGGVMAFMALMEMALGLFKQGKMAFGDLAGLLRSHGASDADIDAAQALVEADIKAIDDEAAAPPADPQ